MPNTSPEVHLSLAAAAALAETSVATIRRRIASGRLRAYRRGSDRAVVVARADVLALTELRPVGPTAR